MFSGPDLSQTLEPLDASRAQSGHVTPDADHSVASSSDTETPEENACNRLPSGTTFNSDFSKATLHSTTTQINQHSPPRACLSYTDPAFRARLYQWTDELWMLVVSLVAFVAIIIFLGLCNNRPLASLPITTSPTTILALLTSLCKGCLTFSVAQAISQWKWNAFLGQRPLLDIETFDASSRGAWGSILFFAKMRRRDVAIIGSLVLALSIVASPITQLVFSFPVLSTPSATGNASVPASWNLTYPKGLPAIVSLNLELGVRSGVTAALGDYSSSSARPMCDTGNCTYPRFQTLGVCSKTYNISHLLNVSFTSTVSGLDNTGMDPMSLFHTVFHDPDAIPGFYNASLPALGAFHATPVPYSLVAFPLNESFVGNQESLPNTTFYDTAIIYSLGPNNTAPFTGHEAVPPKFFAIEAIYYMCVQELESGFVNGVPYTNVVNTSQDVIGNGAPYPLQQFTCAESKYDNWLLDCTADALRWDYPDVSIHLQGPGPSPQTISNDEYTIDTWLIQSYQSTLTGLMWWRFYWDGLKTYEMSTGETRIYQSLIKGLYDPSKNATGLTTISPETSFQILTDIVGQLATGSTDSLRTLPANDPLLGQFSFLISGTALVDETFTHVVWGWLIFLGAQVVIAVGFVLFTIVSSSRSGVEIYKSSMLPMLLALSNTSREVVGPLSSAKEMRRRAKSLNAKLLDGELVIQDLEK